MPEPAFATAGSPPPPGLLRTSLLTAFALVCFAANSILCRLALGEGLIDPATFLAVRTGSAAAILVILISLRGGRFPALRDADHWASAGLFGYLLFFTFAYVRLTTGTGALVLFGAVQLTMFTAALHAGARFPPLAWGGLVLAFAGVVYLVLPGVTAPDPWGATLMALAGMCWGLFSLRGRRVADALSANARAFVWSVPPAALVLAIFWPGVHMTAPGLALAIASGAITSGIGYAVWYAALRGLAATQAATLQLLVPLIAALGGIALLGEDLTLRIVVAAAALVGGVSIALARRSTSRT